MSFPTNDLSKALNDSINSATGIKNFVVQGSSLMATNNVSANQVIQAMLEVQGAIDVWTAAQALPGMAQYAKDQFDDQALDIVAEFNTMKAAAQAIITWIDDNFPKNSAGYILKDQIVNGGLSVRSFTPAQTAGLRTVFDALAATIG